MHYVVGAYRRENFGALLWKWDLRVGKHHHDIHGLTLNRLSKRRSIVSKRSNFREIWHNFYRGRITPDTHNASCKPRDGFYFPASGGSEIWFPDCVNFFVRDTHHHPWDDLSLLG